MRLAISAEEKVSGISNGEFQDQLKAIEIGFRVDQEGSGDKTKKWLRKINPTGATYTTEAEPKKTL